MEANSVSVIPIENLTKTTILPTPVISPTEAIVAEVPNTSTQNSSQSLPTHNILQSQNTKQFLLQQQLETAAVLMDISKKVIISPPSSNPQSPCLMLNNTEPIYQSNLHSKNVKATVIKVSPSYCPFYKILL